MLKSDRNTIRERAYFLWLREGRPEGRAQDHWGSATIEEFSREPDQDAEFTEDEEKVIKEAATKARNEFLKSHPEARDASLLENTAIGPITSEGKVYNSYLNFCKLFINLKFILVKLKDEKHLYICS